MAEPVRKSKKPRLVPGHYERVSRICLIVGRTADKSRGLRHAALLPQLSLKPLSPCSRSVQEAELEGLLFGRDEEALEQLGQEVGGGGEQPGSLADFLRSYASGTAGSGNANDGHSEDEERQRRGGSLVLLEDRQGVQPAQQRQRRRPVWEDPQDAQLRVNVAARSQLRKLRQTEDEAELTGGPWDMHETQRGIAGSGHTGRMCCIAACATTAGAWQELKFNTYQGQLKPFCSCCLLK